MKMHLRRWLCVLALGLAACDAVQLPTIELPNIFPPAPEAPGPTPTTPRENITAHCAKVSLASGEGFRCNITIENPIGVNSGDVANEAMAAALAQLGITITQEAADKCALYTEGNFAAYFEENPNGGKPTLKSIRGLEGQPINLSCEVNLN